MDIGSCPEDMDLEKSEERVLVKKQLCKKRKWSSDRNDAF